MEKKTITVSPYGFFKKTCAQEIRRTSPITVKVNFQILSEECSKIWKVMSEEAKAPFIIMAQNQDRRNPRTILSPKGTKRKDSVGNKYDHKAPRRPVYSFLWFCVEFRSKVEAAMPPDLRTSPQQVTKELGRLWKRMSVEQRKPFKEMGNRDRARYEEEMAQYIADKNQAKVKEDTVIDSDTLSHLIYII